MSAALLLPLLLGTGRPAVASLVWEGLAAVLGIGGCAVIWGAVRQGQHLQSGTISAEKDTGRVGLNPSMRVPLVTLGFIVLTVFLSLALPEAAIDRLCGLRFDDPGLERLIRITAARSLLHDTVRRMIVNTVLLGLLGLYMEHRLGALRTLMLILMGSFIAGLIGLNLVLPQAALSDGDAYLLHYPPAGGTGAAAALLGFGIRGWNPGLNEGKISFGASGRIFKAMDTLWPLLTALVFWGPFSGHTMPLTGSSGMAGYWGQAGGFLGGMALALVLRTIEEHESHGREALQPRQHCPRSPKPGHMSGCAAPFCHHPQ
jgi:membrane associated rhomboid family serine protease